MPRHIVIVGGGIAGITAAYELARLQREGSDVTFTLIEQSKRLGGIVETVRQDGFVMETGPDGWVTDKPWARDLAEELGLANEIIPSNDAERVTYVLREGRLQPMPEGMRMMVPSNLEALQGNPLFSDAARASFAAEPGRSEGLKSDAPEADESVASFVTRHFGDEVLRVIGAPLLNGVFGGDVEKLSVQAVMQPFVQMEREHGSLILAVQQRAARGAHSRSIFTSLRSGMGTLVDRMAETLPAQALMLGTTVRSITREQGRWKVEYAPAAREDSPENCAESMLADAVLLATPVRITSCLLSALDERAASLVNLPTSSAVTAAFGFDADAGVRWPKGFGFLVPAGEGSRLLAATFADQKFCCRVPPGGRLVRAYFGGSTADELIPASDETIAALALEELRRILGTLPEPTISVVRRWPEALPQYEVGHLERMAELDHRIAALPDLSLLGNGYRGVGVPDLVRDARSAARKAATPITDCPVAR